MNKEVFGTPKCNQDPRKCQDFMHSVSTTKITAATDNFETGDGRQPVQRKSGKQVEYISCKNPDCDYREVTTEVIDS